MVIASSTEWPVKYVRDNGLVKQQEALDLGGITTNQQIYKSKYFGKNEKCMQKYLYCHFEREIHNGFLGDVSVTLIE